MRQHEALFAASACSPTRAQPPILSNNTIKRIHLLTLSYALIVVRSAPRRTSFSRSRSVGAFFKPTFKPLQPSVAHACFFDMTHDNESIVTKRSAYDLLASSAVIAMSNTATGSNRGYDEIVSEKTSLEYSIWCSTHCAICSIFYSSILSFIRLSACLLMMAWLNPKGSPSYTRCERKSQILALDGRCK